MKWRLCGLVLVALVPALFAMEANTYLPAGWTWSAWPYVYDASSQHWYYFSQADEHWCMDLSGGGWVRLADSSLTAGWSYWAWPYAYNLPAGKWFYVSEGGRQWVSNLTTAKWSLFGTVWRPFSATWQPGQSIGRVALGDTFATVRLNLGEPDEIRQTTNTGNGAHTLWTDYDSIGFSLAYDEIHDDGKLEANEWVDDIFASNLFVTPPQWTYQGLSFGSSMAAAKAVLGEPSSLSTPTLLWWTARGVMLYFYNDMLKQIYVSEPIPGSRSGKSGGDADGTMALALEQLKYLADKEAAGRPDSY